ncbi:hypothetical protein FHU29_001362 [Hoyosella altamirensis]|uniref:Uncharacterized protein n=1 Tax=Hoyosella altamirensis TaxID=616997 RepID=A0A839RL32_9ACTN|nr:hypothetical protein [Hoyosella altamirensis]
MRLEQASLVFRPVGKVLKVNVGQPRFKVSEVRERVPELLLRLFPHRKEFKLIEPVQRRIAH